MFFLQHYATSAHANTVIWNKCYTLLCLLTGIYQFHSSNSQDKNLERRHWQATGVCRKTTAAEAKNLVSSSEGLSGIDQKHVPCPYEYLVYLLTNRHTMEL